MADQSGRRATSVAELTDVGLRLFFERGFDETTVDDIAAAAGIGRRTFFRYFASKNDLPWGDFDAMVAQLRADLAAAGDEVPMTEVLRRAVIAFNRVPREEIAHHRQRMQLLLRVPTLLAHSTLRYEEWRAAIAEYAGRRLGAPPDSLRPQVVAWTYLAVTLAAYEEWLRDPEADLDDVLDRALTHVEATFGTASAATEAAAAPGPTPPAR